MYHAPPSFIANAHSELYEFYTGKGDMLIKIPKAKREGDRLHRPPPLNPPLSSSLFPIVTLFVPLGPIPLT